MPRVVPTASPSLLVRQKPTGFLRDFDYSLNPYSGCVFRCGGCYVPDLLYGRAERLGGWGSYVEVRVRAREVLRARAGALSRARIFMSPLTDVWQPAERRYRLTRSLLVELRAVAFSWLLLSTRSPLAAEDIDLLQDLAPRVEVGVSLPSDLEEVRRRLDPANPPVRARLDLCRRLREAGVPVRLQVAPMQPHSPDFPRIAAEVADWVWIDYPCHLRVVRPVYEESGLDEWLSPDHIARVADTWRTVLDERRLGFGQADFGDRWDPLRGRRRKEPRPEGRVEGIPCARTSPPR